MSKSRSNENERTSVVALYLMGKLPISALNANRLVGYVDNRQGPDVCLIAALLAADYAHMTRGKLTSDALTVTSKRSFERKFGTSFKVTVDWCEVEGIFELFEIPEHWL